MLIRGHRLGVALSPRPCGTPSRRRPLPRGGRRSGLAPSAPRFPNAVAWIPRRSSRLHELAVDQLRPRDAHSVRISHASKVVRCGRLRRTRLAMTIAALCLRRRPWRMTPARRRRRKRHCGVAPQRRVGTTGRLRSAHARSVILAAVPGPRFSTTPSKRPCQPQCGRDVSVGPRFTGGPPPRYW